jgi:hypothetical protein
VIHRGNDWSPVQEMEIDISGQVLTITQTSSSGWGSAKVIDFPAGHVTILSALVYGPVTTGANSGATEALLVSVGTSATADSTLNSAEVNVVASTSTTVAARAGTVSAGSAAAFGTNGIASATDLFLNIAQAANVSGASSATFGTGSVIKVAYQINAVA